MHARQQEDRFKDVDPLRKRKIVKIIVPVITPLPVSTH